MKAERKFNIALTHTQMLHLEKLLTRYCKVLDPNGEDDTWFFTEVSVPEYTAVKQIKEELERYPLLR